jgi:hypothetical protein
MKSRLPDPSEICALEFKGEFLRFRICSVSTTIDIDRSIFQISGKRGLVSVVEKKTVSVFANVEKDRWPVH